MDLAGNVAERTLDYANAYPPTCVDCLNTTTAVERSLRGGGFASKDTQLRTPLRGSNQSGVLRATIGFRCVHDLN